MTITSQTTQRGKVIHLVSSSDLVDAVQSGERLRASCPIHGSDHQRSLSIDLGTGWGFCHSCHATVLVQPNASVIASSQGNRCEQRSANGDGFGDRASAEHLPVPSVRPYLLRRVRSTTPLPHWQQEEVAALRAVAPIDARSTGFIAASAAVPDRTRSSSTHCPGKWRWLPLACGLGTSSGVERAAASLLKRWIGRIIFPLGSPDGQGFIGRTLLKWEPGMDENAHKALLDQPGAPRRWIKTNPAGWFGFDAPACLDERVVLVEGGFDRLVLLAAGFPANAVIALVGTAARPAWLARFAPQVKSVVLALDADDGGAVAMERLAGRVPAGWLHRHAVSTTSRSVGQGLERTMAQTRPAEHLATLRSL